MLSLPSQATSQPAPHTLRQRAVTLKSRKESGYLLLGGGAGKKKEKGVKVREF